MSALEESDITALEAIAASERGEVDEAALSRLQAIENNQFVMERLPPHTAATIMTYLSDYMTKNGAIDKDERLTLFQGLSIGFSMGYDFAMAEGRK